MIKKILAINKKNIKRLLSSKFSFIAIVLGPLLMISIIGLAFSGSSFSGVGISFYSEDGSDIIDDIILILEGNDFNIINQDTLEDCLFDTISGNSIICVSVTNTSQLRFYVDQSRGNLANPVLMAINHQVDILAKDISIDATESILGFLDMTSTQIQENLREVDGILASLDSLQINLMQINNQLAGFNVENRLEMLSQINDPNSELSIGILSAKEDIETLEQSIEFALREFERIEGIVTDSKHSVDRAFIGLECPNKDYKDLSPYILDDDLFVNEVVGSSSPECSLVYTLVSLFDDREDEIRATIDEFRLLQLQVQSSKEEINELEKNIFIEAHNLESDLSTAGESRDNIQSSLRELELSSKEGESQIVSMKEAFSSLSQSLQELSDYNAEELINPITYSSEQVDDIDRTFLDFLFPSLLLIVIMFVSVMLGAILIIKERISSARFRNDILPVNKIIFLIGMYLTSFIFVFLQIIIFLVIGVFFFKSAIVVDPTLFLEFSIIALVFVSVGIIISSFAKTEEIAILSAISFCVLMLIFSNILIPIETMTAFLASLAKYSPFNVAENVIRTHMIYGIDVFSLSKSAYTLFFTQSLVILTACYVIYLKR